MYVLYIAYISYLVGSLRSHCSQFRIHAVQHTRTSVWTDMQSICNRKHVQSLPARPYRTIHIVCVNFFTCRGYFGTYTKLPRITYDIVNSLYQFTNSDTTLPMR